MDYISVKEAAQKWGIKERRVRTICSSGQIPGVVKMGKSWLIPADATKPIDHRIKTGQPILPEKNPAEGHIELLYQPIYIPSDSSASAAELEKKICYANALYLCGQFEEAISAYEHCLIDPMIDDGYSFAIHFMLYSVHVDLGHKLKIGAEALFLHRLLHKNKNFIYANCLIDLILHNTDTIPDIYQLPRKYLSEFCVQLAYPHILQSLKHGTTINITQIELIFANIDTHIYPVLDLYRHIILSFYYFITIDKKAYHHHVKEALSIALPNQWYVPLAQYSYCLDWHEVKAIDPDAYDKIYHFSEQIITNYQKSGFIFSKQIPAFRQLTTQQLQIAFLIAARHSNQSISEMLNISMYQVKQAVQLFYDFSHLDNRQELIQQIRSNFSMW